MVRALFSFVLLVSLCTSASAQSSNEALRRSGLVGSWAVDCKQPPSQQNPFMLMTTSQRGNPTRVLRMEDVKLDRTTELANVKLLGDGLVQMQFVESAQGFIGTTVTIKVEGNRHWGLHSVDRQGKTLVKDGRFTSNGNPVPVFTKCSGG